MEIYGENLAARFEKGLAQFAEKRERVEILDNLLDKIIKNGDTSVEWSEWKDYYVYLFEEAVLRMGNNSITGDVPGTQDIENSELIAEIETHLVAFRGAPFTIQRITELLLYPDEHYTKLYKYLKALHHAVNVHGKTLQSYEQKVKMEGANERRSGGRVIIGSEKRRSVDVFSTDSALEEDFGASKKIKMEN